MSRNILASLFNLSRGSRSSTRNGSAYPVSAEMRRFVEQVRAIDVSACSDQQLKESLVAQSSRFDDTMPIDAVARVFAVVAEAVRRRLGVWKLFDESFDKGDLGRLDGAARSILETRPYADLLEFYTDTEFFLSEAFESSLTPCYERLKLDGDERVIAGTMVRVAELGKVGYWSDVMLPAEFYRCVRTMDHANVLRFEPSDEQLMAGYLIYQGDVVEMNAGEGKTVAGVFPAVAHALQGRSVHVMTANDYLAHRDAEWMAPVYESLGFSVGAVMGFMGDDERRYAYGRQIVYGTLREFGFDYLRDNLRLPPEQPVQRGLDVVIVDEADHTLIDRARTPLVISAEGTRSERGFEKIKKAVKDLVDHQAVGVKPLEALLNHVSDPKEEVWLIARLLVAHPDSDAIKKRLAKSPATHKKALSILYDDDFRPDDEKLTSGLYYAIDHRLHTVALTDLGQEFLENLLGSLFDSAELERELSSTQKNLDVPLEVRRKSIDQLHRRIAGRHSRMNQVYQMLRAYVLMKRDVDYVVSEGAIVLIDPFTGRTLPDDVYQKGLHAAIQAKEGVIVHHEPDTLAQTSVEGFVRRYSHASGMTGTACDARNELGTAYGLKVQSVPPSRSVLRTNFPTRVFTTREDKLAAIVDEAAFCQRVGRPVLIGTRTIEQSREISLALLAKGVAHRVLNAVTSDAEADVVRNAGQVGAVTVSTNMAGRGTDIILDPNLDATVAANWVRLVKDVLCEGAASIEVSCPTSGEAQLLRDALANEPGVELLEMSGERRSNEIVVASLKPAVPAEPDTGGTRNGKSVRFEFGLGLYVIGTEMNEAGRIDRQLRGRAGRQGAFGASRFFLSLEDDLLAGRLHDATYYRREIHVDVAGRSHVQGARMRRSLERIQGDLERDAEAHRAFAREFARVLESQTLAYYRARRELSESESFTATCRELAYEWALRMVGRYFPERPLAEYAIVFREMTEAVNLDTCLDCAHLEGESIPSLPRSISELVVDELEAKMASLGADAYGELAKLLYLQTADEAWREHLQRLQEMMTTESFNSVGVKSAVAECVITGHKLFGELEHQIVDLFVPRLINFPVEESFVGGVEEVELVAKIERILV